MLGEVDMEIGALSHPGARLKKWASVESNWWRLIVAVGLGWLLVDYVYEWSIIPAPATGGECVASGALAAYGGLTLAVFFGLIRHRRWAWSALELWALSVAIVAALGALIWGGHGLGAAVASAAAAGLAAGMLLAAARLGGVKESRDKQAPRAG
jgi:hypothetical protein